MLRPSREGDRGIPGGGGYASWMAGLLVGAAVLLVANSAAAWDFDKTCGARSDTRSFDLLQPQVYVMLDKSGSMGWDNKWSEATTAIKQAVSSNTYSGRRDPVQFGLGLFSSRDYNKVSPREDAYPPIRNHLNWNSPGGGTYMGNAIERSENTLASEPQSGKRPQATIFTTDGYPSDSEKNVVNKACEHRKNVGPLYAVGFGQGTDESFNDLVAAAGGTGYCCKDGGTCTASTNNHVDPCKSQHSPFQRYCRWWDWDWSWYRGWYKDHCIWWGNRIKSNWECGGGKQTNGGTGLKAIISGITNDLACQIDVDQNNIWERKYSDKPYGCSTDNYNCLDLTYGTRRISYNPSNPSGRGWHWVDQNKQDLIQLNEQTCNEIEKSYTSNTVSVQRACMCGNRTPGRNCANVNGKTCACRTGTVTCMQSQSQCKPDSNCPAGQRIGFGDTCKVGTGVCVAKGTKFCGAGGTTTCGKRGGSGPKVVGESGRQGGLSGKTWRPVSLSAGLYSGAPVVMATPQTANGGSDPSEAHLANVSRNGFATQHCELDVFTGGAFCDGHATEVNGWVALDPGEANKVKGMRVGTYRSSSGTEVHDTFNFGTSFSTRPYVFATAQTRSGADVPRNTQVVAVNNSQATVEFCEQQSTDGCSSHGSERVGWLAVDPTQLNLDGVDTGEFTTKDSGWKRISFSSAFSQKPAVIADVQTEGGGQEALYPEVKNVTTTGADIRYCESEGDNGCDSHATERIAWIAFDPGKVKTQSNAKWSSISPGGPTEMPEVSCDGKDNDCDGQIDEGQPEVCDGKDNDCDGRVDENTTKSCPDSGKPGRCKRGRRTCSAGSLNACKPKRQPIPEICNGLDDDCNGIVDDIKNSWSKNWNVTTSDLTRAQRGKLCRQATACVCPSSSAEIGRASCRERVYCEV